MYLRKLKEKKFGLAHKSIREEKDFTITIFQIDSIIIVSENITLLIYSENIAHLIYYSN